MIKPTPRFLAYKVPMVNVGTEKIPIKGKGYMMVTVSEEKGTFGTIEVDSDVKEIKVYNTTYKIAGHDLECVTRLNYSGEDLESEEFMNNVSTVGKSVDIAIYNCKNGEQIW